MEIGKVVKTCITVVGSGLAGLSTVFFLNLLLPEDVRKRVSIALVSRSLIGYGTTSLYSMGVFRVPTADYTYSRYLNDMVTVGRYVNKKELVEVLARNALDSVLSLVNGLGLRYRLSNGTLSIVSDELYPGRELMQALRSYILSLSGMRIKIIENCTVLDISRVDDGVYRIVGAVEDSKLISLDTSIVVIATGGVSNIYARSDNPRQLLCDGHGVALRLGLPLVNMEFIQFFPLGLAEKGGPQMMIPFTNAVIVNRLGENIIEKYGLTSLKRALQFERDALSRYMMMELAEGLGIDGTLLLLPRYDDEDEDVLNRFAKRFSSKLNLRPPIKVLPLAHSSLGGIEVDRNGQTALKNLYAVGEVVGGIHGANRLGGNALTSCVVFAKQVARAIADTILNTPDIGAVESLGREPREVGMLSCRLGSEGRSAVNYDEILDSVREIMWNNVGVIRVGEKIEEAIDYLENLREKLRNIYVRGILDMVKLYRLENALLTALSIAYSALSRCESRGCHFRADYPKEDASFQRISRVLYKDGRFYTELD